MKATSCAGRAATILSAWMLVAAASLNAQQRTSVAPRSIAGHPHLSGAHLITGRTQTFKRPAVAAQSPAVHFNSTTNSLEWSDGTPVSLQQLLNPVPGLGFDEHHLSVLNQDLGIKALIDPATEWKIAEARRFMHRSRFSGPGFYILDGGAYFPAPDDSVDQSAEPAAPDRSAEQQQQPQVIVVEAPQSPEARDDSSAQEQPEEQIPDVGQFTLVLRNGRKLEAVAFSHVNDEIIYISTDGNRRSFPITDLNSDATVEINVERGTPLQLPL